MLFAVFTVFAVLGASFVQIAYTDGIVAFTASYDGDRVVQNGQTLVLNKVLFNQGGGYNTNTGIFTAPIGGIYQFQMYGLTAKGSSFWINLLHNNVYVISAFARSGDYSSAGNSVFVLAKKNDQFSLRAVGAAAFYNRPDEIYTTWSGQRIATRSGENV